MKNLSFAIIAIATMVLFSSCEASNDPGYDGPCNTCGTNGNGGGQGNGGGGINNGTGQTLYGYVYDLNVSSSVTVYPDGGGQPYTVPVSTNLGNDMRQYLNLCTMTCEKRYWVNVTWVPNALNGISTYIATSGSASPNCN